MNKPKADISIVGSGAELLQSWQEIGYPMPAPAGREEEVRRAWADAIEADTHDALVARLGLVAVGFVTVKWAGPVSAEPEFKEALIDAFPDEFPVPVVYSLYVNPDHRGQGIGRSLMEEIEERIVLAPVAPNRVALSVKTHNDVALSLYSSMGYKILPYKGQQAVSMNVPKQNEAGEWVRGDDQSHLMVKELTVNTEIE